MTFMKLIFYRKESLLSFTGTGCGWQMNLHVCPSSDLLFLDINDNNAQSSYKTEGLDTQEPEQHPKHQHNHRLHDLLSEVKLGETNAPQTLIELPKKSAQPLAVIHQRSLWLWLCYRVTVWSFSSPEVILFAVSGSYSSFMLTSTSASFSRSV